MNYKDKSRGIVFVDGEMSLEETGDLATTYLVTNESDYEGCQKSPPGDCREHIEVTDEVNIDESYSTVKA